MIAFDRDGIDFSKCDNIEYERETDFIAAHETEIEDHYYDKVDRYCAQNDISPKDYFGCILGMKDPPPYPEKFNYSRFMHDARDKDRGQ